MLKATAQGSSQDSPNVQSASSFGRLVGAAADSLAPDVRALHCGVGTVRAGGAFRAYTRSDGWVDVPMELLVERRNGVERWDRWFGSTLVSSTKTCVGGLLVERIGTLEFRYRVMADRGGLVFDHVRTSLWVGRWRLRIPRALGPRVTAVVRPGLRVSIDVRAPLLGRILAYRGVVEEVREDE